MVNPNHITPYGEISEAERELADDLVFNRRDDALEIFIQHFEAKGPEAEAEAADPTAGMEPEEALHWHILRRKRDGVEAQIDACVEKIGAVPTLNTVLLPAMKEVGDKFGAGELILPFVLQSAEVMKRAVAQLEQYLDKLEGYTKGTVVLATVFGDVHDIGKSLVNTILTNNGYTVVDLGKQVPISTILDAAKEHKATAIGLSALLVSTSKQMPLAIQELHSQNLEYPVLLGGAAINRKFALRAAVPGGQGVRRPVRPGRLLLQGRVRGPGRDGPADRARAPRRARRGGPRGRDAPARGRRGGRGPRHHRRHRALRRAHRRRGPRAAVLGRARDRGRPRGALHPPRHPRAVQAALGRARREGRGVAQAARGGLPPAPGAHVGRGRLPASARAARLLPVLLRGQRHRRARPGGPRDGDRALHVPAPAQGRPPVPGRLLPPEGLRRARRRRAADRHRRLRGHRADGQARAGGRVRRAALRPRPRRADRRGPGRVAALARAQRPRHRRPPGPPLLLGLPGRPGPVRAPQGRAPAEPLPDRHGDLRRLRADPGAVHARADLPTTPRPATTACATAACCPTARPTTSIRGTPRDPSRFGDAEAFEEPAGAVS